LSLLQLFIHSIKLCSPVKNEYKNLTIPPYVLGCWLGDGGQHNANYSCADKDSEIIENIRKEGFEVNKHNSKYGYGILNLVVKLRELNLIKNKHIPDVYLNASISQRLELLQGLMDTDGYCSSKESRCEFCNTNKALAYQVYELVTSLGIKATIIEGDAKLNGVFISKKYRVTFMTTLNVFKLKRKLKNLPTKLKSPERYIVKCEKISSVPVKCISVNSPSHLFLCSKSYVPTHNSDFLDQIIVKLMTNHD